MFFVSKCKKKAYKQYRLQKILDSIAICNVNFSEEIILYFTLFSILKMYLPTCKRYVEVFVVVFDLFQS